MSHDDLDRQREHHERARGETGARVDKRAESGPRASGDTPSAGQDGLGMDLATLGAFVDGELPPGERAAMHERLAGDALAARRAAAYFAQKSALQALCGAGAADPAPPPFLVLRPHEPWWRRAGLAAAWVAVGVGLTLALAALGPRVGGGPGGAVFFADEGESFARRADIAYAVYTPERRHAVEVGAADEAQLVAWLSKRLGRPLSVPSLGQYGYTFVGGRLLPGVAGPAAQFMYENEMGERLTLYVSASPKTRDRVRLLRDGSRRTFYWSTDRTGYALSGPPGEGELRKIAYVVCSALGGSRDQW